MPDTRIIDCACDGGYRVVPYGIDRRDGAVLAHWYRCDVCNGSGEIEIEVFPITEEDLT